MVSQRLKNFLSKLPLPVLLNTEISPNRVQVPGKIDSQDFTRQHRGDIEADTLTTEKALHVGATHQPSEYKSATSMLYGHLVDRK